MLHRLLLAAALLLAPSLPAQAACSGQNLLDALPADERAALAAAAEAAPYPSGLLWRATKGDLTLHLVGTYHLDDPRHADTFARIEPLLDAAQTILVEAGPDEEKALMADLARDPGLMVIATGPTLREALPDAEWTLLAEAMRERGLPPFMASKFQPWYVSMLLALPACEGVVQAQKGGLDRMVITHATTKGIPIRALESHQTVFRLFRAMSFEEQLDMLRSSLALEPISEDYAVTLADTYFRQDTRIIWELTRKLSLGAPGADVDKVEQGLALMEQTLMTDRNRAWIPVLEEAAAQGPAVAAFGALHLPGDTGVLNLLEQAGWTIERLPL